MSAAPIHPRVDIGHVHLKVADLDRALAFYQGVLGFALTQRMGRGAAFLSAGGYHHHIGLNTWESLGGSPPPREAAGLYRDRDPADWPRDASGELVMVSEALDLRALLAEAP